MWGRELLKGPGLTQCPGPPAAEARLWQSISDAPLSLDVPQGCDHSFNVPESLASKSLFHDLVRLDCPSETISCRFRYHGPLRLSTEKNSARGKG